MKNAEVDVAVVGVLIAVLPRVRAISLYNRGNETLLITARLKLSQIRDLETPFVYMYKQCNIIRILQKKG
jgi:hypothetical protein